MIFVVPVVLVFSFNDPATTEIYTLSLHDALPISADLRGQARLKQIVIVRIDADHPRRATAFHLDGVKAAIATEDRKSTRLNSSHSQISYAVFCLKKKTILVPTGIM